MEDRIVLAAENLGKSYTRYSHRWALLLDRFTNGRGRGTEHWAVRGVTFELRKGESLGILGRNGAGKSTLLAMLAGVLQPSEGAVGARGKVLALLDLGAGMDPEATGRQNARIHLLVHGVKEAELDTRLAEVATFADIGSAFDEPVRTYSSGMFLRLAFAANTVLTPEVLLIDEALAVGDVFFQQKCHRKMQELRAAGVAVVIVSHNTADLQGLCERAMWISDGKVKAQGSASEVVHHYLMHEMAPVRRPDAPVHAASDAAEQGCWPTHVAREQVPAAASDPGPDATVRLTGFALLDEAGRPTRAFAQSSWMTMWCEYAVSQAVDVAATGFKLEDARGNNVCTSTTLESGIAAPLQLQPGRLVTRHEVRLEVKPGPYTLTVGFLEFRATDYKGPATVVPAAMYDHVRMHLATVPLLQFMVDPPRADGHMGVSFHGLVGLPTRHEIVRPQAR